MTLKLTNTRTKQLDEFMPLGSSHVSLYTCGPTVYNDLHVGNWAAYIYWDILVRVLILNNYTVERVMNITDVGHLVSDEDDGEDKLEKGARREGTTAWEIAERYSESFIQGMEALGLITPEHLVRATDFIEEQLALVRSLKQKGYTYQISDGIYFDTSKFSRYADFAQLDLTAQKAGARVEFNPEKRQASDFALWKFTPTGQSRDMEWPTPADLTNEGTTQAGFPGWHLECSAMAMNILGETIDIHTGGIDHIPVHHTNEIAQSESASGKRFANYWIHNNHIKANGTKISKSLGNGYTLKDLKEHGYSPLDYRMFVLQSHYSNEGNFTFENLAAAHNRLMHWRAIAALRHQIHDTINSDHEVLIAESTISVLAVVGKIKEALDNDLNTPEALRIIDETFALIDAGSRKKLYHPSLLQLLETIDDTLGLQLQSTTPDVSDDVKELLIQRQRARDEKNWQESDCLRTEIESHGIIVRDNVNGEIWEYAN
jgi:cysteinyl-tRNA synthetase